MVYLIEVLCYLLMAAIGACEIHLTIKRFIEKKWFISGMWFMSFIWTLSGFIQMSIY